MSGSRVGNPDHTFSKASQPKTAPRKQTLHSLKMKGGKKAIKSEALEAAVCHSS